MIRQFEFKHVPEILVKYRIHSQQGSSQIPAVVADEGNALWIDMMENLSEKEKILYEGTLFQFYHRMAEHLRVSPYTDAFEFANGRAENSLNVPAKSSKVTVIIPFYNRIAWTLEAIKSVLNQTYANFEIILVDDGSTDDVSPIVDASVRDPRIMYVRQDNKGAAAARNHGIQTAHGDYITFLDSDDLYLPEKLEVQVRVLGEAKDFGMAYSHAFIMDADGSTTDQYWGGYLSGEIYPDLLFIGRNRITTPTVMVRAEVLQKIGGFDETLTTCEDLDLWRRIAKEYEVFHIVQPLVRIRTQYERFNLKNNIEARKRYYEKAFCEDEDLSRAFKMSLFCELYSTYARLPLTHRPRFYNLLYGAFSWFYYAKQVYYESSNGHSSGLLLFFKRVALAVPSGVWDLWKKLLLALTHRIARLSLVLAAFAVPKFRKPLSALLQTRIRLSSLKSSSETQKEPTETKKAFALVSHALPPSVSPQAVIIERILRAVKHDQYCLISRADQRKSESSAQRLPGRYHHLPTELPFPLSRRVSRIARLNLLYAVFVRGWRIARIANREQCKALVAVTGDIVDLPAAYLASRLIGVPFIPYFFDDYTHQRPDQASRSFAASFAQLILANSANVIVTNEFLGEVLYRKYKASSVVVSNPRDNGFGRTPLRRPSGKRFILYVGAIDDANLSAFRRIIAALDHLSLAGFKFHLYTPQSQDYLKSKGVEGSMVEYHADISRDQVPEVLESGDILFLPLSFNSAVRDTVRTSAPGNLADCLASGTPILAFAPPQSFVQWYFEKWECGLVVTENSKHALADATSRLIGDANLRTSLSRNARQRARVDFDPEHAKEALLNAVGLQY
jgi:glycosyltransferase involved in cell wall biosynthesis